MKTLMRQRGVQPMRLSTVVITAILGTSSLAGAQPDQRWRDRDDVYAHHDHRWTTLATSLRIEGKHTVELDLKNAPLQSIELQAIHGGMEVGVIGFIYADGTQGSLQINQPLDARTSPIVRFDVGPAGRRGVRFVTIQGQGDVAFRVIGR